MKCTVIRQLIHRFKARKSCIFERNVQIDSSDCFEGRNRLAQGGVLLNSKLGFASYIGEQAFIKNTVIGRYSCISSGVKTINGMHPSRLFVSIHPAFYSTRKQAGFTYVAREKFPDFKYIDEENKTSVMIGNDVWIGMDTKIMEGITIGDGAIVAAGAIVTHDVPPYAIVAGIPARILKYRFDEKTIDSLLKLKWWNKDTVWIQQHAELFENVERLLSNQIKNED